MVWFALCESGGGGNTARALPVVCALLAGACAPAGDLAQTPPDASAKTPPAAEIKNSKPANSAQTAQPKSFELSEELIYQLLLARIAMQRGQHHAALDALTRAAKLSGRRDITEEAFVLAARLNSQPHVIELAAILSQIGASAPHYRAQLWLARASFQRDEYDAAVRMLIDLTREFSNNESVLREIATELMWQARQEQKTTSEPVKVLRNFREASKDWPREAALHWVTALLAFNLQENAIALDAVDTVLEFRRGWQNAAMLKLTHLADNTPAGLTKFAEEFFRDFPEATRARTHYGQLLLRAKRNKKSLEQFEIVLSHDPRESSALLSSAVAQLRLHNPQAALIKLKTFTAMYPRHEEARLYLAEAEAALENFGAAEKILRNISSREYALDAQLQLAEVIAARDGVSAGNRYLMQLTPRNQEERIRIILQQDFLFREYEMFDHALDMLARALEEFPQQPDLLYHRGLLAAQLDLLPLHESDMRALISQQPDNAHAHNALGYTLADRTDRFDEALALISRALALQPNDPFILDSMGWVHFRLGRHDAAIKYLRRALDMRRDPETAAHLGEALWTTGKRREAREIWERGREWGPDNMLLRDTLERFLQDASLQAAPLQHAQ